MDAPNTQKKEKKGLSRAWKKLKESFKSNPTGSSASASASKPATAKPYVYLPLSSLVASANAGDSTPATSAPVKSEASEETPKPATDATPTEQQPGQSDVDRRLEKARAIFKKYDFEFSDEDWQATESSRRVPRERVQKQIRMRVKYACHNCRTIYGHERICVSCQHKRCPECVRYPPKKRKDKSTEKGTEGPTTTSKGCTCHECQSGFDVGAAECPNCKHQICDKCTKEAKLDSAPSEPSTQPQPVTAS